MTASSAPRYELTEKLAESRHSRVYRARRSADGGPVILKTLEPGAAAKEDLARFRREFGILQKIDLPGVVKAYALEEHRGSLTMVLQDIGGTSLDRIARERPLSLPQFLALAIRLADVVAGIHRLRLVHKDINPSHVVLNPISGELALIGFGIADELPSRTVGLQPPAKLEGTLAYLSPEQTGRMNRVVDYRTDLYSLGVTFYELLTGRLPFEAEDALGLVHCHIAKPPVPPRALASSVPIPEALSQLVLKLMAKMADDRYQSAWGLKADLERCLRDLTATGGIQPFELGREDHPDQLRIPQKLYGREAEIDQLLEAFDRVSAGGRELLLVAGYAGVGKTALVHETHRLLVEKRGTFVEGKFDQLQRNVPYFAWIQAFTGLVNYLLMESEAQLARWRRDVLQAVGGVGGVLTEVIPTLELMIGPQPAVPALGPAEAQNRFNYAFLEFIQVVATRDYPLVVFLDDLQWIDAASLGLLQTLMSRRGVGYVLVIGAYRANEVDSLHPLAQAMEKLRREDARIGTMALQDLGEKTVDGLLADVLRASPEETAALTHRIYSKTGGNPFFLLQTLRALVEKQAIAFSVQDRRWRWELSRLERAEITDNVVALMLGKIRTLAPETQQILPLAACMGFQFSVSNLGLIAGRTEERALESLLPALREGLITSAEGEYRFVHDRIQQAAYSLIPEADRRRVHLEIGRLLWRHHSEGDHPEQLFAIVDHLDIGADLLQTEEERLEVARLNQRAGAKAKLSAAFPVAARYFQTALRLLPPRAWELDYEWVLSLHKESAECEYLSGHHEAADALIAEASRHTKTVLDQADVYSIQVAVYISQSRFADSIAAGLTALRLLGLELPDAADPAALRPAAERALANCRQRLRGLDLASLLEAPDMRDAVARARMGLLEQMALAAYFSNRMLYGLLIATMVDLSLRYGNSVGGALGYVLMAAVSLAEARDFKSAGALGRLSHELLGRYQAQAPTVQCKILQFYCNTVAPWFLPLSEVVALQRRALPADMEAGAPDDAINNLWGIFRSTLTASSATLSESLRLMDDVIALSDRMLERNFCEILRFIRDPVSRFQGELPGDESPGAPELDEKEAKRRFEELGAVPTLAHYDIFKSWERFLCGQFDEALKYVESAQKYLSFAADQPHSAFHYFHHSLLLLRGPAPSEEKLAAVAKNQELLRLFAESCPQNFRHHYLVVEAERARAEGRPLDAMDRYDEAIDSAAQSDANYVEGVACELAAEFWKARQKRSFASLYLQRAHRAYSRWGARGKVRALEAQYPEWLGPQAGERSTSSASALDLDRAIKASQAIAREMEMGRLLGKVMRSVLEIAGARTGCLLMEKEGRWAVAARGEVDREEAEPPRATELDESEGVSPGIVRFVARTLSRTVLDDAASSGDFVDDPHIRRDKTKSLLCAPLLSRGKLAGILYLENNLTTHAFTPERVQLLETLLSQAATSLENARVYEALKESESSHRRIVATANEGIWVLGADARTTAVNARMAQMIGASAQEMVGRPMTDFMFEEDIPDHLRKMENRARGISEQYERRFRRKDAQTLWTLASAAPVFDEGGRFEGSFAMLTDITERKRAEAELLRLNRELEQRVAQRTEALEQANKELEAFSYSVSHDLRAPLRAIDGFSRILQKSHQSALGPEGQRYLNLVSQGAARMSRLIDDILAFSRFSRSEMGRRTVDMTALAREVFAELSAAAPGRNIRLISSDLPPAYCDRTMIRQVWSNLIGNAIKYTSPRPEAVVEVSGTAGQAENLYCVRDNGAGFDMQYVDKLFGVFARLHSAEEFEGTGIGLAIVKRVVVRHGGRVWAEGKVGEGAAFYFTLPRPSQ